MIDDKVTRAAEEFTEKYIADGYRCCEGCGDRASENRDLIKRIALEVIPWARENPENTIDSTKSIPSIVLPQDEEKARDENADELTGIFRHISQSLTVTAGDLYRSGWDARARYAGGKPHPADGASQEVFELLKMNRNLRDQLAEERRKVEAANGLLKQIRDNSKLWKSRGISGADQYQGMPPFVRLIDSHFQSFEGSGRGK